MTKTANPATGATTDIATSPAVVRAFSSSKAEVRKALNVALKGSVLVRHCPKTRKRLDLDDLRAWLRTRSVVEIVGTK